MSEEVIDIAGRQYTNAVKNELKNITAGLEARIKTLENRLDGRITRDEVWNLIADRIYVELMNVNSELSKAIRKTQVDPDFIKIQVRDILHTVRIGLIVE